MISVAFTASDSPNASYILSLQSLEACSHAKSFRTEQSPGKANDADSLHVDACNGSFGTRFRQRVDQARVIRFEARRRV